MTARMKNTRSSVPRNQKIANSIHDSAGTPVKMTTSALMKGSAGRTIPITTPISEPVTSENATAKRRRRMVVTMWM